MTTLPDEEFWRPAGTPTNHELDQLTATLQMEQGYFDRSRPEVEQTFILYRLDSGESAIYPVPNRAVDPLGDFQIHNKDVVDAIGSDKTILGYFHTHPALGNVGPTYDDLMRLPEGYIGGIWCPTHDRAYWYSRRDLIHSSPMDPITN